MQRYISQSPTFINRKCAEYADNNSEYLQQLDRYHGAGIGVLVGVLVGANAVIVSTQSGVAVAVFVAVGVFVLVAVGVWVNVAV